MRFKNEKLAEWQEAKGWSNARCAKFVGIAGPQTWALYKTGAIIPPVRIINKIAVNMGISAFDLIAPSLAPGSDSKIIKFRHTALDMWREEHNCSQQACAQLVGISAAAWSYYASGIRTPESLDIFDLISTKLGLDVADLFEK